MGRTHYFKKCLPSIIGAANESPPVEIVIINYNSKDDLEEYVKAVINAKPFKRKGIFTRKQSFITYRKYTGRDYYHLAHAWNLAIKTAKGKYVNTSGCDVIYGKDFFKCNLIIYLGRNFYQQVVDNSISSELGKLVA